MQIKEVALLRVRQHTDNLYLQLIRWYHPMILSMISSRLVQVRTSSNLRDTLRADVCRVETAYWVWVRFISDGFSNPLSASDEYPALNIWKLDKENGSSWFGAPGKNATIIPLYHSTSSGRKLGYEKLNFVQTLSIEVEGPRTEPPVWLHEDITGV